jgi:hypothetical protein
MSAALIKIHAALLVYKSLQELEFRFGELNLSSDGSHTGCVQRSYSRRLPRQSN